MSKFAMMKQQRAEKAQAPEPVPAIAGDADRAAAPRAAARQGKKAVSGYFSAEVSRGLNVLAAENGTTLQALMGEAIDLLMRQYGKHPFGER
ncbi:ribbon-helix-helix domain-containing protein [uncultured Sphingomonas sp.]|uniref:ribbon-helix-helix domain-containing protein n=1 Tax=uncultured Sphingomonas sp. TaxID=158754 RepID=UPI0035C9873A